jgi:hypothetical protein
MRNAPVFGPGRRQAQHEVGCDGQVSLVTLRRLENKFTGTRVTDTGNRLFGTKQLA